MDYVGTFVLVEKKMARVLPSPRLVGVVLAVALLAGGVGVASLIALSDVETTLDSADREAIATLHLDSACAERAGYDDEIRCLRALQARLLEVVPDRRCAHRWGELSHEPSGFLERAYGCCYDRSRIIEKTLAHYGFEVRHLSLHEMKVPRGLNYIAPGVQSHSISEVRTARGWLVVDSNHPFLGLTKGGEPLDSVALREVLARGDAETLEQPDAKGYVNGNYSVFYGLYSRHGGFYPPHVPIPDIDWNQIHHNL